MGKRTLPGWWMKNRAVAGSGGSIIFVLICIFGGVPSEMAAQESLASGSRVRVTALDCGLRGRATLRFRALRADTLVLDTTECPLASVTRFDVSRGQKSHTGLGLGIGFAAGALGAVLYCKTVDATGCVLLGETDVTPAAALLFGALGGLVGAIAGHSIKTDLWEEVPLERLSVSLAPQRDGRFALGFSVRF